MKHRQSKNAFNEMDKTKQISFNPMRKKISTDKAYELSYKKRGNFVLENDKEDKIMEISLKPNKNSNKNK